MPYLFELLNDRPILLNTISPPLTAQDVRMMTYDTYPWISGLDHPVYYVVRMGDTQLELDAIMTGLYASVQGRGALVRHKNIIETIVISTEPTIARSVRSVAGPLFQNVRMKLFPSMDEALGYIDSQLRSLTEENNFKS